MLISLVPHNATAEACLTDELTQVMFESYRSAFISGPRSMNTWAGERVAAGHGEIESTMAERGGGEQNT